MSTTASATTTASAATTKRIFIERLSNDTEYKFREVLTNVTKVELKSIQIYNSCCNISESLGNNVVRFEIYYKSRQDSHPYSLRQDSHVFSYTIPDGKYVRLWEWMQENFNKALNSELVPENLRGKIKLVFSYNEVHNDVMITAELDEGTIFTSFRVVSEAFKLLGFSNPTLSPLHGAMGDYEKKLFPFSKLYVHCDLDSDREYNGKRTDILYVVSMVQSKKSWKSQLYSNLDCSFAPYKHEINSLKLWLTDEKGVIIDFNDYPILYELEITTQNPFPTPSPADELATKIGKIIQDKFPCDTNMILSDTNEEY